MLHIYMPPTLEQDKRGLAELLILSLTGERPRHGYEIARAIAEQSGGVLDYHVASLYPILYRMEREGLIQGRWVEKAGERRRRFYRLTAKGKRALRGQRESWVSYLRAVLGLIGAENA